MKSLTKQLIESCVGIGVSGYEIQTRTHLGVTELYGTRYDPIYQNESQEESLDSRILIEDLLNIKRKKIAGIKL